LGNPGITMALTDLYEALARMPDDGMIVDTKPLEEIFGVSLTSIADHIRGWPSAA